MVYKKTLGKRVLSLALIILMVLSCVPMSGFTAFAASTNVTYISGVAVSYGAKESTPKDILTKQGYTVINYDLNDNAGGRYIYIWDIKQLPTLQRQLQVLCSKQEKILQIP